MNSVRIILLCCLAIGVLATEQQTDCPVGIAPSSTYNNGTDVNLAGKVVLVTGVSSDKGIGRATAILLSSLGAEVYGCARTPKRRVVDLEQLTDAGVVYIQCDVRSEEEMRETAREIKSRSGNKQIDLIVNAAGVSFFGYMNDMKHHHWRQLSDTNSFGAINVWHAFQDRLAQNATFLSLTSSTADYLVGFMGGYAASKRALEFNLQHLAWENMRENVSFVNILPAATNTNILKNAMRSNRPSCAFNEERMYNAQIQYLSTAQPPQNVAQAVLSRYLKSVPGKIDRVQANAGPVDYFTYTYFAKPYFTLQPQQFIEFNQGVLSPRKSDPATCYGPSDFPSPPSA